MSKLSSTKGASVTELGLLAGLIAIVIIGAISTTGTRLNQLFATSANSLNKVVSGAPITAPSESPIWLENGLTGTAYAQYNLAAPIQIPFATGKDITYSYDSGDLNGLTFNPSTLTLSGTPTVPGKHTFTLKATNADGATLQQFDFIVDKFSTCKEVSSAGYAGGNGTYPLFTGTNLTPSDIYCDMTTDGGGWTEIIHGPSTSLPYLNSFDLRSNNISSLTSHPSYGISWGNDSVININIDYSEVLITYSGLYTSAPSSAFALLQIRRGGGANDILLHFTGYKGSANSGQNLTLYGTNTVISGGTTDIINRTDRLTTSANNIWINMNTNNANMNRYISSLKVR